MRSAAWIDHLLWGHGGAVRAFACDVCGGVLFFDNSICLKCGTGQVFDPDVGRLVRRPEGADAAAAHSCANADLIGCNWAASPGELWCDSCRMTRTRPSDTDGQAVEAWAKAEAAKRYLLFQLADLGLRYPIRADGAPGGLAFDLLSSSESPVTTGHEDGIVTIDMAEGIDSHRERVRAELAEPYRTLLGHFRHEVGHFFEWFLVERVGRAHEIRPLFGDERESYADALDRHYRMGPPAGWEQRYVSAYATMHPYEDFAETFAHYLHIRDTVQTASAFGLWVGGPDLPEISAELSALPNENVRTFDDLLRSWVPLTLALNAINRSMGLGDLYPFVIAPAVAEKLSVVDSIIRRAAVQREFTRPRS